MKKALEHIAILLLVVLSLSGCHRKGRVIPAGTLEQIYVDMFLADQWVKMQPDARKRADTTLFYEPIFRRYGYSFKDYEATVSHYIDRPDKFVKILRRSAKDLNIKHLEYAKIADRIQKIKNKDKEGYGYEVSDFLNADSILFGSLVLDSLLVRDSVYIKEPEPDTLAVADTLKPEDVIVTTSVIEIKDVERGDRIRSDKKQAPGKFTGHKPAPDSGQNM